ncbi:hypothetical protein P152DRAFT_471688 [Eremomyces bilateralis CBS 781.70]|uniref:BZIP domain-containing protein n=1 Tax=Eremomyces bilateralis CBS 781.70 TaxID=1392243 RepID=A0A6G1GAJ1_9PEZI|nr:uncharacterized protein P152DRAFT_471688 [Eremomyces bilateralis CBS 781.70]KAF1815044.1 hypothetical protein P152DRAFT_471688 [Eremomyces bilateralis CBS 781.70]
MDPSYSYSQWSDYNNAYYTTDPSIISPSSTSSSSPTISNLQHHGAQYAQYSYPTESASSPGTVSGPDSVVGETNTSSSSKSDRVYSTSAKRRAQNRLAQRAFRERKEKYARDLEHEYASLMNKYSNLEIQYAELDTNCQKLRQAVEVLMSQEEGSNGTDPRLKRLVDVLSQV